LAFIIAFSQDKDSLLQELYQKGLIGREAYLRSISKEKFVRDEQPRILEKEKILKRKFERKAQGLRKQLKYKFALDFLMRYRYSDEVMRKYDTEHLDDSSSMTKLTPNGKYIVEEFMFFDWYKLYKFHSYTGNDTYFILGWYCPALVALYLFKGDTIYPAVVDTFELGGVGGSCTFGQMNGCNIMHIGRTFPGVGHYSEGEGILAIVDNKFRIIFSTRRIEITHPEHGDPRRTMNKLSFVDLNNDGFIDILEESTEDIVAKEDLKFNPKHSIDYKQVKAKELIARKEHKYIWNDKTKLWDQIE
jgi:hypothetical protein